MTEFWGWMMAYKKIIYNILQERVGDGEVYSASCGVLAYMAGCHRTTASRVISDLEERGLIDVQRAPGCPNQYQISVNL